MKLVQFYSGHFVPDEQIDIISPTFSYACRRSLNVNAGEGVTESDFSVSITCEYFCRVEWTLEYTNAAGEAKELKVHINKQNLRVTYPLSKYVVERATALGLQKDDVSGILKHIAAIGELNKSINASLNEVSIGEPLVVAGMPSVADLQVRIRERIEKFTTFLGTGDHKSDGWNVLVNDDWKSVDNYCDFSAALEKVTKEKVPDEVLQSMLSSPIVQEVSI